MNAALNRSVRTGTILTCAGMVAFVGLLASAAGCATASGARAAEAPATPLATTRPLFKAEVAEAGPGGPGTPDEPSLTPRAKRFVAYYFHRTLRCPTCLSIEKQSLEAIESMFAGELSAGTLEWRAINIEEAGNEHFEADFALDSQALVLVEIEGATVRRWVKLGRVWELVDNPPAFGDYVVSEVAAFLGG